MNLLEIETLHKDEGLDPPGSNDYHAVYAPKNLKINEIKSVRVERSNREIYNCSWELQNTLKESEKIILISKLSDPSLSKYCERERKHGPFS